MTGDPRSDIRNMYRAAVERVHAGNAVERSLQRAPNGSLVIGGELLPIPKRGVFVIAIGKAAREMIEASEHILGDDYIAGIAVTKAGHERKQARTRILVGSHPVPDQRSLDAGAAVLEFARSLPPGALTLCLISGGGSALVESLYDDVTLDQLRSLTSSLLRAGASIQELNAVRSRLSRIKSGGLLQALGHTQVVNLIMSDVLGDDLHAIASGPTVPPVQQDTLAVLRRYGIDAELPDHVVPSNFATPRSYIIASIGIAIDAAVTEAISLGYHPVVLSRALDGEARHVGRTVAAVVADSCLGTTSFGSGTCLLAGGETTVTVRGAGSGGRNTEAALAAAIRLSGTSACAIGFLATDGDDGLTGAAGAIVDGETVTPERRSRATTALDDNDSYTFLATTGATWSPGPTETNVNDLVIAIIP